MTSPAAVRSYHLLLPPDWRRVPVRYGTREALDDLLDEIFAGAPRDSAGPYRTRLRMALEAQVAAAKAAYGLDLYLPVSPIRGRPAAASFVVSHLPPTGMEDDGRLGGQAAVAVLTELVGQAEGEAHPLDVAGEPAARLDRVVAADPGRQRLPAAGGAGSGGDDSVVDRSTRHVDYVVTVPGHGGWLVLSFSTAVLRAEDNPTAPGTDSPRFDELLVELFDAMVSTLRWRRG